MMTSPFRVLKIFVQFESGIERRKKNSFFAATVIQPGTPSDCRPSAAHLQILSVDDDDDVEAEARMELCKAIEIPPYAGRDLCGVERDPPDMNPFEMDFQNPCVSRYH